MNLRLTISALLLMLFMACSKEMMDTFRGFGKPLHFPEPVYNLQQNPVTPAGFALGKMLFFDSTLSADRLTSCGSCHMPSSAFTHHEHDFSHGLNGAFTKRNAPPLFNLAWSTSFMWDGSVGTLDKQPLKPLTNPIEMGMQMPEILRLLNASNMYRRMFADAFGKPIATEETMMKALSQFMLLLVSSKSLYDSLQQGLTAFTPTENAGYQFFKQHCGSCHREPLFTDNQFHNTGLPASNVADSGRMHATGSVADLYAFKTPSLRNLSFTKPYMHDGRFSTIDRVFDHYQKTIPITPADRTNLKAFLKTLDDSTFIRDPRFAGGGHH
jgi:cytochrome c peroxidase